MTALSGARARSLVAVAVAAGLVAGLLLLRNAVVADPLERLERRASQALAGAGRGTFTWQGSWKFPRGGPYILGFESRRGPAALHIDGRRVVWGAGKRSVRRVYTAGVKAVRFEAPPGARLLWHPPGRRGPLEYVPASSLSPEPPEQARFGRFAGASPVDGVIAALIALVVIALGLYLVRPWLMTPRGGRAAMRTIAAWAALVFALALAVRLYDLNAAGQTWDEDVNWSAGRNYITNLLSLDFAPSSWRWNYEHPPVMKYIAGIGAQLADGYGPARALSALVMALACALVVLIGRRLYSLRVGVLAGIIAALTPHLIAHGKIVGHEAPTALWWTLAIWLSLKAHDPGGPGSGGRQAGRAALAWRMAAIGVVLGLAVFSRFVNGLLALLVGAILLITAPPGQRKRTVVLGLAVIAPVAVLVGVAVWPRLWSEPVQHMVEAWIKLKKPHSPEPFLGVITNRPPRHYFAAYLGATAPLGVLAGAALWMARAALRRGRERASAAIALLWLAVPLVVALSPVRQDGVRYIIPSLLALALMAAAGVDTAVRLVASRVSARTAGALFAGTAVAMGVYLAVASARIHPYYLDYYGEHVGGPRGVAERKRFEIAWWGEGVADAVGYVNRHAAEGARVYKRCVEPGHLTWMRADLWATEARRPEKADWIVVYQPSWRPCPVPGDARLVHEVRAQGAPLARVYRVHAATPRAR